MKNDKIRKGIVLFWWMVLFFWCAPAHGLTTQEDAVVVGVLLPLTGKMAPVGQTAKNAFLMAQEHVNDRGGIQGKKIQLMMQDTAGGEPGARRAMEHLLSHATIPLITGGVSSAATFAAAALAQQRKVPLLISTASADRITSQAWNHIFRICLPASEQNHALLSFLKDVAKSRGVAVLFEDTPFGRFALEEFKIFRKQAGLVFLRQDSYPDKGGNFKSILAEVKARRPDMVYVISSDPEEAARILLEVREVGLAPDLLFGRGNGFTSPVLWERAGSAAAFVFSRDLWAPSLPYAGSRDFHDAYLTRYGTPPGYHGAQAYAGLQVAVDALQRAQGLTPEGVRRALNETHMMTVYGPVSFSGSERKSGQNRPPAPLLQWQYGNLESVWPKRIASAPHVYPAPRLPGLPFPDEAD